VPELEFLADMNVSPQTVRQLAELGWSVVRVCDVLDASTKDSRILAYARRHGKVIITQDLDFGALLALGGHAKPSVITLRLEDPEPALVTSRVVAAVSALEEELDGGVAVSVDEVAVRYRRLPIG
jgi:predicted nuclease of predicted toxin-antitoxin system